MINNFVEIINGDESIEEKKDNPPPPLFTMNTGRGNSSDEDSPLL